MLTIIINARILRTDMTSAARQLEAEFNVEERTIRLEERVGFIQAEITEMKADYRHLDAKVDATRDDVAGVKASVTALHIEMKDGFASVDRRMCELATKAELATTRIELSGKIDATRGDLSERIDATKAELSERIGTTKAELSERIDTTKAELSERIDATKAELSGRIDATRTELSEKIDATKTSLMEHTDIHYDRRFFRSTGVVIGAGAALYAGITRMQDMDFARSEIAAAAVCTAIVIWCLSLFGTGRQRR
jgi:chromosome segregation ATPase